MENQLISINANEFGLEQTEAEKIQAVFTPMLDKMNELEKEYNEIVSLAVIDEQLMKRARELRLKYVKIRTGTEEIHQKAKAYYLAGGRFVDAWKNTQKFAAQGKESELEKIEKHFELIKEQEKNELNEKRQTQLSQYVSDTSFYNLKDMSEAGFQELLSNSKIASEAKIEAEKKAEELRIAKEKQDLEERLKMEEENKRLKAEADAKEKQMAKERAEQEKALSVERAKAKAEADAKLKLEEEIQAKKDAEIKKEKEELEAKKQAELAPDKEKLTFFINSILATPQPNCSSIEINNLVEDTMNSIHIILQDMFMKIDKLK